MPKYPPLKYRDALKALRKLNFYQSKGRGTSHQTWLRPEGDKFYAVTLAFHGSNEEIKRGTLSSIIRQSGVSKKRFYRAAGKKV